MHHVGQNNRKIADHLSIHFQAIFKFKKPHPKAETTNREWDADRHLVPRCWLKHIYTWFLSSFLIWAWFLKTLITWKSKHSEGNEYPALRMMHSDSRAINSLSCKIWPKHANSVSTCTHYWSGQSQSQWQKRHNIKSSDAWCGVKNAGEKEWVWEKLGILLLWCQGFSKCGLWASSSSVVWEFARNANSQAPAQTY